MPLHIDPNSPLPRFRVDLRLYYGPLETDGSPTYNLFDPVKGQYYKITWQQSLILQNLHSGITLNELCRELDFQSSVKITREDVKEFFEDALRYNLLEIQKTSEQLVKEVQYSKISYLKSIFYRYLYFRIPIIKPDKFLNRTLPYVLPLVSPFALTVYFILSVLGIALTIGRFSEYVHTFTYFFNFYGLLSYIIGLSFFKLIHEFAHAYTAAYYKIHIPSMGIAFIFFAPVLYTDATDGWKLSNRSDRMKISAAGIISEMILAGLCTLGWALSSQGIVQSIFFVISSVIWISSLFINLNPALRYDGYYLLSDLLGMDNLQSRSFALTRWSIHNSIFGIDLPCPEENITRKMFVFMIAYSFYTWVYRLFLFSSIALFFYLVNVKLKILGVFLFIAIILLFIFIPIVNEICELYKQKTVIRMNKFLFIFVSILLCLTLWLTLPLSHSVKFTGVAVTKREQKIYVSEDAKIKSISAKKGDTVPKGKLLIEFVSKPLESKIAEYGLQEQILEREIKSSELNNQKLPFIKEKLSELESIKNQLKELEILTKKLKIESLIDGEIAYWEDSLSRGQYLQKGTHLGTIAQPFFKIVAFVPENSLEDVSLNQKAEFISNRTLEVYSGYITTISPVRENYLDYPSLASTFKGMLPVVLDRSQPVTKQLKLIDSWYIVEITLNNPQVPLHYGEYGTVKMEGPKKSYLISLIKYFEKIFWRESQV